MSVKILQINSAARRAVLIVLFLISLFCAYSFINWYFGHSIAANADSVEVAEAAARLAPDDPQSHYSLAVLYDKIFAPDSLSKSLAEYQAATALAPNDFRVWLALGKAFERSGNPNAAETALVKSLALAPNYAQVQWTLGNVLLRQGKTSEGFEKIRQAAENDSQFTAPAVVVAWQIFDGDLAQIKQNLGASSRINFVLAGFLIKQKQYGEALEIWNALPAEEKTAEFREIGEQILREMLAAKKYRAALQIENQISAPDAKKYAAGQIFNGGFEDEVKQKDASVFDWRIADGLQPQIGFDDAQKHGGNRSLVIVFSASDGKSFRAISQTIAVEPARSYRFQTFYKSDLKTSAWLKWEIADASDGKVLAQTAAVSNNSDWSNLTAEFTTPENTEAVIVRLVRENCNSAYCPIAGKVWFDDFSIAQ